MAKHETDQEPSIEEILSSIRQIISDDDDEAVDSASPPESEMPEIAESVADDEDVIELTQKIEDEQPSFSRMVEDFDADSAEDEKKPSIEVDMRDVEPEPETPPAPRRREEVVTSPLPPSIQEIEKPEPVPRMREESRDSILTRSAEEAAFSGFAELARKTAVEHGGITLEEIVRSELNPLLRDWLDRNLPSIIERLVREELERVAKRALED